MARRWRCTARAACRCRAGGLPHRLAAGRARPRRRCCASAGCRRPTLPDPAPTALLQALLDEADRYLADPARPRHRRGARRSERRALGRRSPSPPAPNIRWSTAHLPAALAALRTSPPGAGRRPSPPPRRMLDWITYDSYPRDQIGDGLCHRPCLCLADRRGRALCRRATSTLACS